MKSKALFWACTITMVAITVVVAQPQRGGMRRGGQSGPGEPGHHHPPRPHGPSPVMRVLDVDLDRELSAEEIASASAALLTLDTNEDGMLSRDELRPQHDGHGGPEGPGEPPVNPIMLLDVDESGTVSLTEFLVPAEEAFEMIDTDDDGEITEEEAENAPRPPHPPHPMP